MKLKILTWNIAGSDVSERADLRWDTSMKLTKIREEILKHDADICMIQEISEPIFAAMMCFQTPYFSAEPVPSHSGYTGIFINNRLKPLFLKFIRISEDISAIGGIFKEKSSNITYSVISCHLSPFATADQERHIELTELTTFSRNNADMFIIGGDMNVRKRSDKFISTVLNLKDSFIEAGSPGEHSITWDPIINWFYPEKLMAHARFDRILFSQGKVNSFNLIANTPIDGDSQHFLSDHFGILTEIEF